MQYIIHSMGMPFNGYTIKQRSLGGSESAAYYMARELAARGHRVVMFTNSPDEGMFEDVLYCYSGEATQDAPLGERFTSYACTTPHDVLIIQRHPLAFHKDYASKVNVLQLHDLALVRSAGAMNAGGQRLDIVTTVSEFHAKQVREIYGFREKLVRVVPNGVDPTLYSDLTSGVPGRLSYLYQSRPERGLEHLVRPGGIMSKMHEAGSNARLYVCAYDNTVPDMRDFYDYLKDCAEALPNVTMLGALTKADLAKLQMGCDALVYPTEFEEVSCITAMEAMHAGLPFISSSHAALPETCKDSGSILIPLKDGKADEEAFVETLLAFENAAPEARHTYRVAQREAAESRTWAYAVSALEKEVARVFRERSSSPARMARHFIEHSDISALDEYFDNIPAVENGIERVSMAERDDMFVFADNPEVLLKHYEKHEGEYLDNADRNLLAEGKDEQAMADTTRVRGICALLTEEVNALKGEGIPHPRVLEFGCAHGHITNYLAKEFPTARFVGMDFMRSSIDIARKRAESLGRMDNAVFVVGSVDDVETHGPFDVIIAPEVIEHIWDYLPALEKLREGLTPEGVLIVTTPFGRWEWTGPHKTWIGGREHLHHFERADIEEIFAGFHPKILYAPAGSDRGHAAVGSYVYSARVGNDVVRHPLHDRDYTRKFHITAPRDTVSLCMIVHNAQESIGKALRSVVQYMDEVVISVDPKTTDLTLLRIKEVEADYPFIHWNVFIGDSPMDIGFDAARNRTIDESCGDWIFWLDADEEVVGADNIFRCLRPGAFNAYAIAQHHMSQDPPTCITTDHPSRLFRRDSGARFYGVVHEHPEVEIGKAIPHTQQISDIRVIHYGYKDEAARRGRFQRNFPLLLKDLEKHPNRTLNKFLYLRDLAQGIAFEGERTGTVTPSMVNSAHKVVELFDKLIDENPMLRMTLDALPYYSTATATLGGGFNATIHVETRKDELPGLKAAVDVEGRFHNRETYTKLLARIASETTVNYDGRYL